MSEDAPPTECLKPFVIFFFVAASVCLLVYLSK
jgi:hypothetical protein